VLHLLLYGLLAIIVAAALFLIASRFLPAGEQIAPSLRDEPPWDLPAERALTAADIDGVRLPVALRGYRFAETDILLDRLAGELRRRDDEIARLQGHPVDPDAAETTSYPPEAFAPPEASAPPEVSPTEADGPSGDGHA
jgi:hypothetical protein